MPALPPVTIATCVSSFFAMIASIQAGKERNADLRSLHTNRNSRDSEKIPIAFVIHSLDLLQSWVSRCSTQPTAKRNRDREVAPTAYLLTNLLGYLEALRSL